MEGGEILQTQWQQVSIVCLNPERGTGGKIMEKKDSWGNLILDMLPLV